MLAEWENSPGTEGFAPEGYSGVRQRGFTLPPRRLPLERVQPRWHHITGIQQLFGVGLEQQRPAPMTASVTTIPTLLWREFHPDRRWQGGATADEDDKPNAVPGQRRRRRQRTVLVLPSRDYETVHTAFALEVALYYAVLNAYDVDNVNFELAWLKDPRGLLRHSGGL